MMYRDKVLLLVQFIGNSNKLLIEKRVAYKICQMHQRTVNYKTEFKMQIYLLSLLKILRTTCITCTCINTKKFQKYLCFAIS